MSSTYRPQAEDTSIEADRHLFTLLEQRRNEERMAMTARHTLKVLKMSLAGLKGRFGHLSTMPLSKKWHKPGLVIAGQWVLRLLETP